MMVRIIDTQEEIYCPTSGKLLARVSRQTQTIYLHCRQCRTSHPILLQDFLTLLDEGKQQECDDTDNHFLRK
jgi:hypothetical protein